MRTPSVSNKSADNHNQLGFALQLCAVRFAGRYLNANDILLKELIDFIDAQIALSEIQLEKYINKNYGAGLDNAKKYCKLVEPFVAGTKARCAGTLVNVNKKHCNPLFSKALRDDCLPIGAEIFDGEIEADGAGFGGIQKGKRGRETPGKSAVFRIFEAWRPNGTTRSIRTSFWMPNQQHLCRLFAKKWCPTASFMPIVGGT